MKKLSYLSIIFTLVAITFLLMNIVRGTFNEVFAISGISCLLVGAVLSFFAIYKQERTWIKYLSPLFFFATLLWITLFEPFQVVRIITWLTNIS